MITWRSPRWSLHKCSQYSQYQISGWHRFDSNNRRKSPAASGRNEQQWRIKIKGLSINHKKTKCMVISKSETPPTCTLKLGDIKTEQVDNFNYLGSVVTSNGRCKKEIRDGSAHLRRPSRKWSLPFVTECFQFLSRTVSFNHLSGQWFSTARNHGLLTLKPARNVVSQAYAQDFLGWKGYQWRSPKSSPERETAPSKDRTSSWGISSA